MLNLNVPALIKVREGITINLALSVSQAVETGVPQYKLKDDVKKLGDEGKLNRKLVEADYELNGTADTVTFWFIDAKSLVYRVGEEITDEDFARISEDIGQLIYVRKK